MNLSAIFKSLNISSIAKGTSSTLNVIKKIIPVYKEVKPFISKEKSFFKKDDIKKEIITGPVNNLTDINDSLTFFH